MSIDFPPLTAHQQAAIDAWEQANNGDGRYEYADNHRWARKGVAAEEAAYELAARRGCCGSEDVELETPDGVVLYGFNYGH